MKLLIGTIAASAALALPVLAQDAPMDATTMTCADFTAMDAAGQTAAVQLLEDAMSAGTDTAAATGTEMEAEATTEGMDTAAATGAEMETEATTEGTDTAAAATTEMGTEATAEGTDMAAEGTGVSEVEGVEATAAEEPMATEDPMMMSMMTACQTSPDLLAMDALMQSQGGN